MPNKFKIYLILLLCFFYCMLSEANSALGKCKASFTASFLSAFSDIPFSGKLPLNQYDVAIPAILATNQNEAFALQLTWSDVSGFYNRISTDFRSSNPFSYRSDAPKNILIRGVTYKRPEASEMKNILDEFLIAAKLQVIRGGIWEACFTTITIGENILSGRAQGESYLIEREYYQALASLSFLIGSQFPGLHFLSPIAQSAAVSIFNSFVVRKTSRMHAVAFSFSNGVLSYVIVLPALLTSKYWSPVNDKPLLRWVILMMPYLLEQAIQVFE
ncbi:MAG: hypothetical protein ACR2PX_01470 [Endozoicomonas sp.]|uniref:hypothetical protein n=1 Tax=Endozoicomonas sp. TaxID=1892382 RepID=UPI003D9B7E21